MIFPFNVYVLAIIAGLLTSLGALPLLRRWCLRTGLVDEPGARKIHDQPIALAGGLAVITGLLVPTLLASLVIWWQSKVAVTGSGPRLLSPSSIALLNYGLGKRAIELMGLLLGALGMVLVGWFDDRHELRPSAKFAGQLLVALLVAACGARITLFVHSLLFSYLITILWLLTVINAMNFLDNMNGLCAGLGAIGAWGFALLAAADNQYLVTLLACLSFGALLGFLPHNFPSATAFLGDSGSHLVGYLLAVLAILPHFYTARHPQHLAVLKPLLVLAVPLLDLVWVVCLRWWLGLPFYQADTNHLSHRLVRLGLTRSQAVVVIWIAASLTTALACLV
jgi:UDP-GlcNAc:undecaprenyl-phosphate/decaprenyl-phosphate GlcNAc-1-phosphate transferase